MTKNKESNFKQIHNLRFYTPIWVIWFRKFKSVIHNSGDVK